MDALKREFVEECQTSIEIVRHVYTTENFVKSAFNEDQIVAVYYLVLVVETVQCELTTTPFAFSSSPACDQVFRWAKLSSLPAEALTFQLDQHALALVKGIYR